MAIIIGFIMIALAVSYRLIKDGRKYIGMAGIIGCVLLFIGVMIRYYGTHPPTIVETEEHTKQRQAATR